MAASGSSIRAPSVTSRVSAVGGQPRAQQRAADDVQQPGVDQLVGRQVDRDGEVRTADRGPFGAPAGTPRSSTQAPIVRIAPDSSAMAMNSSGLMSPASGWCQRISASTPTCRPSRQRNCGWQATEISPRSSASVQPRRDLHPPIHIRAQPLVVGDDAVAPARLGPVHGRVRGAQQVRREVGPRLGVRGQGGADVDPEEQLAIPQRQGRGDRRRPGRRRGGPAPPGRARPGTIRTNSSPASRPTITAGSKDRQASGHLHQHLVAGLMAEGVVDVLETVEVDDHRTDGAPGRRPSVRGPARGPARRGAACAGR